LIELRNLLVQAAMAGYSDGGFCSRMADAGMGMVTLGGYNADAESYIGAVEASGRRREFPVRPDDLLQHLEGEVARIGYSDSAVCVNLRFSDPEALTGMIRPLSKIVDIIELNAHCRQPELTRRGAGEALLDRVEALYEAVQRCSNELPTAVKVRAIDYDRRLSRRLLEAGATCLHLDLMKPGFPTADLDLLTEIASETDLCIIGNNSVRDPSSFMEMLDRGAHMASMARPLIEGTQAAESILESEACLRAMVRASDGLPPGFTMARQGYGPSRRI
jgi:TIM-barrel protein